MADVRCAQLNKAGWVHLHEHSPLDLTFLPSDMGSHMGILYVPPYVLCEVVIG